MRGVWTKFDSTALSPFDTAMLLRLITEYPEVFNSHVVPRLHPRDIACAALTCRGMFALRALPIVTHYMNFVHALRAISAIKYRIFSDPMYVSNGRGGHRIIETGGKVSIRNDTTRYVEFPGTTQELEICGVDRNGDTFCVIITDTGRHVIPNDNMTQELWQIHRLALHNVLEIDPRYIIRHLSWSDMHCLSLVDTRIRLLMTDILPILQ